MKQQNSSPQWVLLCMAVLLVTLLPQGVFAAGYAQRNLASDVPLLADYTDPNMVNVWGIAVSPFWICNNRSGTYNVNTLDGTPTATITQVPLAGGKTGPGRCTGAVRNNNAAAFRVNADTAGTWLLDTEDGLITIRSGTQNVIKVDNSSSGAVYKGLALSNTPDLIFAANFNSGKIDVYDGNWAPATVSGTFTDPTIPAGFAPFNAQNIGGKIYVTYAKQDADKKNDVPGRGNGYVRIFDLNGNLLQPAISGGPLNSPWGVQVAPTTFGDFKGAILVGNFGDGLINAFDATTGAPLGFIAAPNGDPIINQGLWALQIGAGGNGGDPTKLYFTAGIGNGGPIQSHGLFGAISVAVNPGAPPVVPAGSVVNGASYTVAPAPVAPGSIAVIFGSNMTDGTSCLVNCGSFDNGTPKRLRTFMNGTQVTVNNNPVPIYYASPAQLAVQIPTDVSGPTASLVVTTNSQPSAPINVNIAPLAPGIFTLSADGKGPGVITHNDTAGTPISAASPAQPGETVVIYATGLGQTAPSLVTGAAPSAQTNSITSATVTIDGLPAQVGFSGLAGCCVGLNQINVVVPAAVRRGTSVNVVVGVGGQQSNTVTLPISAAPPGPTAPPPVSVSAISLETNTMEGGLTYQGTVVLSAAAASDTSVKLASSNPAILSVPASVTVPSGATSGNFLMAASAAVATSNTVTISAGDGDAVRTTTVTVKPAPPPPSNPYDY